MPTQRAPDAKRWLPIWPTLSRRSRCTSSCAVRRRLTARQQAGPEALRYGCLWTAAECAPTLLQCSAAELKPTSLKGRLLVRSSHTVKVSPSSGCRRRQTSA